MKADQSFKTNQRLFSTWRGKFYIVTKVEQFRIRVLLDGSSNLRYWIPNSRARKIFIPAEEVYPEVKKKDHAS